jgi:hypothetical protein
MSMIPFTLREMTNAWRSNLDASKKKPRSNAHRLLLFYAVECGLKAILMKREGKNYIDAHSSISGVKHSINRLLEKLRAGNAVGLKKEIVMKDIKVDGGNSRTRRFGPDKINQMWRYGGGSSDPTDEEIEGQLLEITQWIKKNLRMI